MADAGTINLDDALVTIEKRCCCRPRGRKNKSKIIDATPSSITPTKRHRGHPLGSKNKKPPTAAASAAVLLDISLAQPIVPQASAAKYVLFLLHLLVLNVASISAFLINLLNSWMVVSFMKLSSKKSLAMGHRMNWRLLLVDGGQKISCWCQVDV
jgi:hypothetical protein